LGNLVVTGRVAVTVAVAPLFAVRLHRTVARVLGKTWLQSGGLALAGRAWNCRSPAACAAGLVLDLLCASPGESLPRSLWCRSSPSDYMGGWPRHWRRSPCWSPATGWRGSGELTARLSACAGPDLTK